MVSNFFLADNIIRVENKNGARNPPRLQTDAQLLYYLVYSIWKKIEFRSYFWILVSICKRMLQIHFPELGKKLSDSRFFLELSKESGPIPEPHRIPGPKSRVVCNDIGKGKEAAVGFFCS